MENITFLKTGKRIYDTLLNSDIVKDATINFIKRGRNGRNIVANCLYIVVELKNNENYKTIYDLIQKILEENKSYNISKSIINGLFLNNIRDMSFYDIRAVETFEIEITRKWIPQSSKEVVEIRDKIEKSALIFIIDDEVPYLIHIDTQIKEVYITINFTDIKNINNYLFDLDKKFSLIGLETLNVETNHGKYLTISDITENIRNNLRYIKMELAY